MTGCGNDPRTQLTDGDRRAVAEFRDYLRERKAADPWATIAALAAWLDKSNGSSEHEQAMRLMKLSEETGEVMQAYIGMTGQNPRKGITHTAADVADELCDVIVTAMVALHQFTDQPAEVFEAKVQRIAERVGVEAGPLVSAEEIEARLDAAKAEVARRKGAEVGDV